MFTLLLCGGCLLQWENFLLDGLGEAIWTLHGEDASKGWVDHPSKKKPSRKSGLHTNCPNKLALGIRDGLHPEFLSSTFVGKKLRTRGGREPELEPFHIRTLVFPHIKLLCDSGGTSQQNVEEPVAKDDSSSGSQTRLLGVSVISCLGKPSFCCDCVVR